jgi:hypothetical protein
MDYRVAKVPLSINGREYAVGEALPPLDQALGAQLESMGLIATDKPLAPEPKRERKQ